MTGDVIVVETTLPADAASERLIADLIEARLAACANWWGVRSAYWWNGQVEHAEEWWVAFKTQAPRRQALVDALNQRHPYQVPFVAWHPLEHVAARYADWVAEESSGGKGG